MLSGRALRSLSRGVFLKQRRTMMINKNINHTVGRTALSILPLSSSSSFVPENDPSWYLSHRRSFHASPKHEILPLIGAATVLLTIRYSYKALQRMNDEWEDYQWHLKEYEKQHSTASHVRNMHGNRSTLGLDIGTVHMIWAYQDKQHATQTPAIVPTHEGGRYTFCGVVDLEVQDDTSRGAGVEEDSVMVGQAALGKFYEFQQDKRQKVQWPYRLLLQNHESTTLNNSDQAKRIFRALVRRPLEATLDRFQETSVRSVVALSPSILSQQQESYADVLRDATQISSSSSTGLGASTTTAAGNATTFVPEPVAAIWGAQQLTVLPSSLPEPVLVLDVGGHTTALSVVVKDVVKGTCILHHVGGETFLEQLVQHVLEEHAGYRNDSMAVQRLHVAGEAAMAEFNTQTRAHIHVPYIGMDLQTKQAQHLDMYVSRKILEQRVQRTVLQTVLEKHGELLSQHMPSPTDFSSLWTSLITQVLEKTSFMPTELSHILLLGGGAKHAVISTSVQEAVSLLTGQSEKLVVPEIAVRSELVAIGAASLVPNYYYEADRGLVRNEDA